MTFNDDARIGTSRTSRRGRTTGIAVGGGGLGLVAVVLISQLLGVDLTGLLGAGGGAGAPAPQGSALAECDTGADANENLDCRMEGAASALDAFWSEELDGYVQPQLVLFDRQTTTACGGASSEVGPFYCPPDQTVYIDTAFFTDLRERFGAEGGPLAELYVVAHEWGHHIQNTTGVMQGIDRQSTGPDSDAVRLEVQADCLAGAWVRAASTTVDASGTPYLEPVSPAQIEQALSAASAVGDDRIQASTGGQVQPETWTHGSSEQRQRWFLIGHDGGVGACDTFSLADSEF